jgi:hypothetical protein
MSRKGNFEDPLTVTQMSGKHDGWRRWKLTVALVYEAGRHNHGKLIVVPGGFVSDGPTIPRFLWAVLPVWGTYGRAGVVHDYLCARIEYGDPHEAARTRTEADGIFYDAMVVLGVGMLTRWAMYFGVRIGTLFRVRPKMIHFNRKLLGEENLNEAAAQSE